MDLKKFQKQLIDHAILEGFEAAEVYFQGEKSFEVRVFNGEIENYSNNSSNGISLRGIYNGNMGYAFSERIDDEAINFLINEAKTNAQIIEDKVVEEIFEGSNEYKQVESFNEKLSSLSAQEKIDAAIQMEKTALSVDTRIKSVDYSLISYYEAEVAIQNSKGLDLYNKENLIEAFVSVRAEQDNQIKLSDKTWLGSNWEAFDASALAKEAAKEALSYMGAQSVHSGSYPILLRYDAATDLLKTFVNVFFADNVQKGFSLFKDKINEKVASSVVTINDYAICPKDIPAISQIPFDSEGVAAINKTVVENGVLKTYLHNLKTAKKYGVSSTGNGFKAAYNMPVKIAATNFYIAPGATSCEDIIASMDKGLMITSVEGLHSGANTISGDFSLAASGYLIENGEVIRPIEQITIAGNFFELLKDIEKIASDLRFDAPDGVGVIGSPSLYIKALAVSGL
jgi:PmbA protein